MVILKRNHCLGVVRHDSSSKVIGRPLGLDASKVQMPAGCGRFSDFPDKRLAHTFMSFFRIGIEFHPDSGRIELAEANRHYEAPRPSLACDSHLSKT